MGEVKVIEIHEDVFSDNLEAAIRVREVMTRQKTLFINVMSSPGSGKTTLLIALIKCLKKKYRVGVMDVDIQSTLDAQRVAEEAEVPSIQIHNGGLCHIDADMIEKALLKFDTGKMDILFLENIGNLVCPAEFDTGAHKNIMILSVPEGDDKPLKYPLMFQQSDLVLINKTDTLEYFDFDVQSAVKNIRSKNCKGQIMTISAKTGEGIDLLADWIEKELF